MKKILVIDDSTSYAYCMQVFLKHHGYQTETAVSLAEARSVIREEMPLLICADLELPDGLALELLEEVRALEPQIPFWC